MWAGGAVLVASAALLFLRERALGAGAAIVTAGTLAVAGLGSGRGGRGGEIVYAHGGAAAYTPAMGQVRDVPPRKDADGGDID